jgi:hypothetical protein
MRRLIMIAVAGFVVSAATGEETSNRYLRHPFFHHLPAMELRAESQIGTGGSGDIPFGLLGAFGIGMGESLTVGVYGQVAESDRELPYKSSLIYGLGGFAEVDFDLEYTLLPYAGLRVGMLDPSGPKSPTLPYVGGYLGVKYPLNQTVSLSAAVTLHWAGEKDGYEAFNYDEHGAEYSADTSDVTFDAGVRCAF